MAFADQEKLLFDAGIQIQVRHALVRAALDIMAEVASGKVAVDEKRWALALAVLNDIEPYEKRFRLAVVSNSITDKSSDDDVQAAVSAVWDGIAGVTGEDKAATIV